jgi:GNAT superfamily N-acetyltransferase
MWGARPSTQSPVLPPAERQELLARVSRRSGTTPDIEPRAGADRGHPTGWDTPTMGDRKTSPSVRVGRPDEFADLRRIEFEADRLFESVGIGPFTNDEGENHIEQAKLVLVVGDPPAGFASVELVDGNPHIWQLSVHPDHGRHGLGRALVEAVCDWARSRRFSAITLTTFRDVAWNGPFYESIGFITMDTLTPELSAIREHERSIGDDDFGPRVAMRLAL